MGTGLSGSTAEFARPPRVRFPAPRVDAGLVERFAADGFCRVDAMVPPEEVAWLREVFDFCFREKRAGVPGGYFDLKRPYESSGPDQLPQVLHPERLVPALRDTVAFRNAQHVAAALLEARPEDLEAWGHMIAKPPRVGGELPWHQDEAYWDPRMRYRAVGVWMPLDPATLESGCMQFIPGSHRGRVLPHRHIEGDADIHGLETTAPVDVAAAVAVPVEVGGATVHRHRTLHRSFPNRSPRVRRAWANEFQLPPARRARPLARPWVQETVDAWARRDLESR